MKIFTKIRNKMVSILRICASRLGLKKRYKVNELYINIDFTHKLPDYRKEFKYYDRFLPHLAKYLPVDSIVIDVGANVGDTLVAMAGINNKLKFICIEAASDFYNALKKNTELLKSQAKLDIQILNEFVGNNVSNVSLHGVGGTKTAVLNGGKIKSKSLDELLSGRIDENEISLLKTDVDGFDWDVIHSSFGIINHNPYLYFECQYSHKMQLHSYINLFYQLKKIGYSKFSFFDNYGQYIMTVDDPEIIKDLLLYVDRQNNNSYTRTIYYYDVLACSDVDFCLIKKIIDEYVACDS